MHYPIIIVLGTILALYLFNKFCAWLEECSFRPSSRAQQIVGKLFIVGFIALAVSAAALLFYIAGRWVWESLWVWH